MRYLFLLLCLALPAMCQESSSGFAATWRYPVAKDIGAALRNSLYQGPPETIARFVPGAPSGAAEDLARALAPRPADQQELLSTMNQLRDVYQKSALDEGRGDSLAAALTFFIASNLTATTGREPTKEADSKLFAQVEAAISATPGAAALSDADQQAMHDWLVAMSGVVLATFVSADVAGSPEALAAAQSLAASAMIEVLGLDPQGMTLDENGLVVIPEL